MDRAFILKHVTFVESNSIYNIANGFVHGKYIILTGYHLNCNQINWDPHDQVIKII